MAKEIIDTGESANDGTGDDLRTAFEKVNRNFTDLFNRQEEQTTATNIPTTGEGAGIFAEEVNHELRFKRIYGQHGVTISETDNSVNVGTNFPGIMINAESGTVLLTPVGNDGNDMTVDQLEIVGGTGISTEIMNNRLTINSTGVIKLVQDSNPELASDLNAQKHNITNVDKIEANNIESLVYGRDIRDLIDAFGGFDFGSIKFSPNGIFEWFVYVNDFDLGKINIDDDIIDLDFGTLS